MPVGVGITCRSPREQLFSRVRRGPEKSSSLECPYQKARQEELPWLLLRAGSRCVRAAGTKLKGCKLVRGKRRK